MYISCVMSEKTKLSSGELQCKALDSLRSSYIFLNLEVFRLVIHRRAVFVEHGRPVLSYFKFLCNTVVCSILLEFEKQTKCNSALYGDI